MFSSKYFLWYSKSKRVSKTGEPILPIFWSTEADLAFHRMDKAKKKRASHRRNVTKLEDKVNDMIGEREQKELT